MGFLGVKVWASCICFFHDGLDSWCDNWLAAKSLLWCTWSFLHKAVDKFSYLGVLILKICQEQ